MSENRSFEPISQPLLEPFDKEWYERFEKNGSFQAYEYLNDRSGERETERQKFEAGEIENPMLKYPDLKLDDLQHKEDALLALKRDVLEHSTAGVPNADKIEVVKQVYRWRLNEKIAEVRLLKAAAAGDGNRFRRYSQFMYGRPSPDIFAYTVNSLRDTLAAQLAADNVDLQQAAQALAAALPAHLPSVAIAQLPSAETVNFSREETLAELGHLINVPEGHDDVDASVISTAFENALGSLRSDGWKVVTPPGGGGISVNQETRAVNVPAERRLAPVELKGLILHEIGTHVARRDRGERTQLRLLGLGLDRYEGGEEGVATVREQAMKETIDDFAGLEGHLAISLAQGLDGTPRDFRQVYEIMNKYYLVKELADGKDLEAARREAAKDAWQRCVRTFRGTDCKTPGIVFTKDIIYREGNIGVWEVIRTRPSEMKRFNVGKYDPTNPRHLWILTEIGITESALEALE